MRAIAPKIQWQSDLKLGFCFILAPRPIFMVCLNSRLRRVLVAPLIFCCSWWSIEPSRANTANTVQELYGAIAYSPSTRTAATATAWVEAAARGQALYQCTLRAQANDCEILLSFTNGYGALALSENGVLGKATSLVAERRNPDPKHPKKAMKRALSLCKQSGGQRCRIISLQSAVRYPLLDLATESTLKADLQNRN